MKTKEEIIEFLNNCYSLEKAISFFGITSKNSYKRKEELQKICEQYGFNVNDLKRDAYFKRQIEQYNKNPHRCLNCGKPIPFEKRFTNKFCDSSCAASYNNKLLRLTQPQKTKENISKSLYNYFMNNTDLYHYITLLNGNIVKVSNKEASKLYYENKVDFETILTSFPDLISKCVICGKEFVYKPINEASRVSKATTCSDYCYFKLKSLRSKESYIKVKESGRFKGWTTRKVSSYAEQFWMRVLDDNNISYVREYHFIKYFLDFKIVINENTIIDLEIDGHQHIYRKEHDKIRDAFLKENGFIIYRIPWNQINSDKGKELMRLKIEAFLEFYNNLK